MSAKSYSGFVTAGVLLLGAVIFGQDLLFPQGNVPLLSRGSQIDETRLAPNWSAIASWPGTEAETSAAPDPNRLTTVIVLDDSGSMGGSMGDAKDAVLIAVNQLPDDGTVAVLALNAGLVFPPSPVTEARSALPSALGPVAPSGGTPLGSSLLQAMTLLEQEAANQRGFGTYRALITTDGQAGDEDVLKNAIEQILSTSPVEVATIGIGIGEGHPLNMPGHVRYVSVSGVDGLAAALTEAAAEQTSFEPITAFETVD
ncbi:vWA domain-containing protein [Actibacterium sp. 188UL27-1]|uniref:VWA domain-containing protein n=1 Tax=Actibacterium sp. 188UL27-1 TaxID=2786961 RepID=UPI00195E4ABC|nr:vWA domain-containing protein [Actibacterium sp. 188UL27-1]MBM7067994.1 VWA domain-containing protein [Actibacterium sp. 188UL27-1]